jgi:alpha-amylase
MTARISLALILHNHQPVGNFGWVIEEVFHKAYEPMVGALERHPGVRMALHYSGPLLEWLDANQPQFLERLGALVARGQVEIVGGGHFEPILVSLPGRDRLGQLGRMRTDLERRFGTAPRGAWLAERVWEPSLPTALVDAGYAYTVLDDNHLRGASVPEDEMWGTYTTDDQGRLLTIFGTEKGLRYRIPWHPVPELISYLRDAARSSAAGRARRSCPGARRPGSRGASARWRRTPTG